MQKKFAPSLILQQVLDIGGDGLGGSHGGVALVDQAVLADQELLKVPLDEGHAEKASLLLLEEGVDGILLVAVDVDLGHQGESDTKVELAERFNLYWKVKEF